MSIESIDDLSLSGRKYTLGPLPIKSLDDIRMPKKWQNMNCILDAGLKGFCLASQKIRPFSHCHLYVADNLWEKWNYKVCALQMLTKNTFSLLLAAFSILPLLVFWPLDLEKMFFSLARMTFDLILGSLMT